MSRQKGRPMSLPWRASLLAVLFALLLVPSHAQAHSVTWSRTIEHMDWKTASHVVRTETVRYPVHKSGKLAGWWTSTVRRSPHVLVRVRFPVFRTVPPAGRRVLQTLTLRTTFYCLTGTTASGRPAGPGIVASYILPWGAHVRDVTTGWEGYVLDHPDALTQADEWLSCPQAFPTGLHVWQVLG